MNPIYLSHPTVVAPQHPTDFFRGLVANINEAGRFACIEPDYSSVIPPMQLRRMSRLLKMGIYSGMECLRQAGITTPDGIITGTAKGSMSDTEKFVKELRIYQEESLNPTPFILSTYNAVNGAIALQTKSYGYNQTFVHRGSSLELSLYDAQLQLQNKEKKNLLVGALDEMTQDYFIIKNKAGYWKKDLDATTPLHLQANTTGSVPGEGAAFFMATNTQPDEGVKLQGIYTGYNITLEKLTTILAQQLEKHQWEKESIDLLVLGMNGDSNDEPYYQALQASIGKDKPVLLFKDFCGEYETAAGFGLWLLMQYLAGKPVPASALLGSAGSSRGKRILFYNHYRRTNHNIILLEAV